MASYHLDYPTHDDPPIQPSNPSALCCIGRELMARIREGCEMRVRVDLAQRKAWFTVEGLPSTDPYEGAIAGTVCVGIDDPKAGELILEELRSHAPETPE